MESLMFEVLKTRLNITRAFLLGLTIGLVSVYFALSVLAETDIVRPDANGTVGGTAVGCTGSLHWECINEAVTQVDTPDTGTDYIQLANTEQHFTQLSSVVDVDTATTVEIWVYHSDQDTNAYLTVGLYADNETTVYGSITNLTSRTSAQWDPVTFSGLTLTQAQLDGMRVRLDCEKTGGGKSNDCFVYALYADVYYDPVIEATVGTVGSQVNLDIGSKFSHIGGAFSITENVSSRNVTSITIEENGSVDADDDLKNVALWYDLDTTAGDGYNCSDQSFDGNETQYGATSTNGFSGNDGTITFTDSVGITTTSTLCLYTVLDVATTSAAGQTIEVEINDPSTDVVVSGTNLDIEPITTVALSGTTIIQAQDRDQIHYHWRNDDGLENDPGGASTVISGSAPYYDKTYDTLGKLTTARLRLQVSNEGNRTSDATQYRLEYGRKISTCTNVVNDSSWIDVGAGGGDWDMVASQLVEGNDTTDISESIGGMPNENSSFLSPNGGQRETSSQTGSLTLTSSEFVELEYSIISTANATEGYTYCFRLTNAGNELETYTVYPEATILADVNVSSLGVQKAFVDIPTVATDVGANFVLTDNIAGDTTIEAITITASGTANFQNDIEDIELWYDLDTTGGDGYDCSDQTYDGGGAETQFGVTAPNFTSTSSATFQDSQIINPTQTMCLYVVYTASSTISDGELMDIKIDDASTNVVIDSGTVSPAALVDLTGTTKFVTDITTLTHYHWRNDDGSETTATAATTSEDAILEELRRTIPKRLRFGIANEGSSTTPAYQYRLEWALKVTTCEEASGWIDVDSVDDAFNMYDSTNLTDGNDTTNVNVSLGGVSDVGNTFFSNNNGVKDTSSQVSPLALPGKNFTDLEFSLVASTTATEGATYCLRLTDAGDDTVLNYNTYAEVSIKPKTDFYIQRGVTTVSGTSGTITAGTHYVAPSASSSAFIRIVGTNSVPAGSPTNTGNTDDVTAYISNPGNIRTSVTFTRPATAADTTEVYWEIIEYVGAPGGANEMIVREQTTATYGASTNVTTSAISSVSDDSDIAVFITGQGNPDTAKNYPFGLSTAAWNSAGDTVTFTRGAGTNAAVVSYAVVEFVGANWKVQRAEHIYEAAGTASTTAITAVNSLSKAFLHLQKRMGTGLNNHSDFGHTAYLSGLGQITFALDAGASSPTSHASVAWVIENTQTVGDTMIVTRANGSESSGTAPKTTNRNIGATISNTQDASLFINNIGNEVNGGSSQNSFPEPILGAQIISETQYQMYVGDPGGDTRSWRAEIVEWPTAARDIVQNYYQFYAYENNITPSDPWPAGATDLGENFEVTENDGPIALNEVFRLRMTLTINSAAMEPGLDAFKLQYAEQTAACDALGEGSWHDVGAIGGPAIWRGTSTPLTDGAVLSTDPPTAGDLKITSVADVAATFEEANPSAFTPYVVDPGEDVEFDWAVQHNGASEKTSYCFRMIESGGKLLKDYNTYPTMRTAGYTPRLENWRWFDDENSLTPTTDLAGTNTAPVDIAFDNIIKLRTTVKELTGGEGTDVKFKLQYSDQSDFSANVFDVASSSYCTGAGSSTANLWCYDDGAGIDNDIIDATVLGDADSCISGIGDGCGTHNESLSTTTATFDQPAYSTTEYEFTIRHDGARPNVVYYFRLYDINNATTVAASTSNPSLVTEGAQLAFALSGVDAGTVIDGETIDVDTSTSSISFTEIPIDTEYTAGYRLNVDTNATEGYKVLMIVDQLPTNSYGATLSSVTGTNDSPVSWSSGCDPNASSCFGYHVEDDILDGGSNRFAADDSYAAVSTTTAEEVMYSSVPTEDVHDIVFKLQISESQPAGDYESNIMFISIPIF